MERLIDSCVRLTLNFVLKTGADELKALGVRSSYRGTKDAKRVQERYVAQAEEIGRDPHRLGRTDRQGTPLPDSGRLMFGHEKAKGNAFSFARILLDFEAAGFHLVDVNILQEDHRDRLFVNFSREGDAPQLQACVLLAIGVILDGWWANLQGFRNPDGRWNMNVSGRVVQPQLESIADKRIVRMGTDGVFNLAKIRQPA
ncbi:hypothetical protein HY798_02510 [Candidatus Falkowbacteria bacterium]|nr:hypothetical protein [Candidatus Falkowbacteria bacterium]